MGRPKKIQNTEVKPAKALSKKDEKIIKRQVIKDILAEVQGAHDAFEASFVQLKWNDKGQFASAVFAVKLEIETKNGAILMEKDIEVPINLDNDVTTK